MKNLKHCAWMLAAGIALSSAALAQQTTERFVPIGMSPGISGKLSHLGHIGSLNESEMTTTVLKNGSPRTFRITPATRVWLDKSASGQSNVEGGLADFQAGRRVEILPAADDTSRADWIKIESE